MLLYSSSLFTLDYDPTTDILAVDWPDVKDFLVPEVSREITILIDTLNHYDVKKLLIDTSKAQVEVKSQPYQEFLTTFALALKTTRLQKFARVGTNNTEREKITETVKENSGITQVMEFRNFATRSEAQDWLLA